MTEETTSQVTQPLPQEPATGATAPEKPPRRRKKPTQSFFVKVMAFLLLLVCLCTAAGSVLGAVLLWESGFYTNSQQSIKETVFWDEARHDSRCAVWSYLEDTQGVPQGAASAEAPYRSGTNFSYDIALDGKALAAAAHPTGAYTYTYRFPAKEFDRHSPANQEYTVTAYIDSGFPVQDDYRLLNQAVELGFTLRYAIYAIGAAALLLSILLFIFLLCAAGHRPGQDAPQAKGLARWPFDLLTILLALPALVAVDFTLDANPGGAAALALWGAILLTGLAVVLGWLMVLAIQCKTGILVKNSLIARLVRLCRGILRRIGRCITALVRGLPLVWRTALLWTALSLVLLLAICASEGPGILLWLLVNLVGFPAAVFLGLMLRRLEKGAQALAAGDLSSQVSTRGLLWDFKRHGEALNSIGAGMTHAVEERLRSERLKTELITNVSHDIKTPLTSIINYADLIGKEPPGSEKIAEYSAVLLRQSQRLQKLTEDLMEVSKAATGNLEVLPAPCEVGVLLTQTAGEYAQRLEDGGLTPLLRLPETPVRIMADGRLLWRVFDNLMNNICKYSLPGTRVYLTLETIEEKAVVSFKNTTRYPLEISAQELTERFVRGDSARSSEGSGLGLAIAKSLMDLQGGELALTVDGDLFKATLTFPLLNSPAT